ncbi:MAG TPA: acetyl-CoA carboxylase [Actinomycetota bacterium]|nr:acetyl-CoA carboxylase [Actinomycetota bacterium]
MTDEPPIPAYDSDDPPEGEGIVEVDMTPEPPSHPPDGGDASLLALIDRLAGVLERSDLTELEVEAGGTGLLLRKPLALERAIPVGERAVAASAAAIAAPSERAPAQRPSVKAPLTGIFYTAPSPGATPYVSVGDPVAVGQVIGLIEAMKLFNEITADCSGVIAEVLVQNKDPVEYGTVLFRVDPSG